MFLFTTSYVNYKRVIGKTIQGFTNQHVGLLVLPSRWLCTQSGKANRARARSEEDSNSFIVSIRRNKDGCFSETPWFSAN